MNTPRRLALRGVAAAALLAVPAMAGPLGLTSLPRAHASCGGWQYISQAQTNHINVYLIRDACNNTFGYSDNAPANSRVYICDNNGHPLCDHPFYSLPGSGPLQSPSEYIQCGVTYIARITTQYNGNADTSPPVTYC